jgi:hypothetical protein
MLRMLMAAASLVGVLSSTTMVVAQSSDKYTLLITNETSWDIHEIHMSSSDSGLWDRDLLGDRVLGNSDSYLISNITFGQWDVKFVDETGDSCILNKVRVTQDLSWKLTDDWLLQCEGYRQRHGG